MINVADFMDDLENLLQQGVQDLITELNAQGHDNTGQLARSMKVEIKTEGQLIVGEISAENYLEYVNRRTKHSFISRAQIAGLTSYFQSKGLSGKDLQGAVWGTARKQVEIGSPLPGSFRFSNNGRRTAAIEMVFGNFAQTVEQRLGGQLEQKINEDFTRIFQNP